MELGGISISCLREMSFLGLCGEDFFFFFKVLLEYS